VAIQKWQLNQEIMNPIDARSQELWRQRLKTDRTGPKPARPVRSFAKKTAQAAHCFTGTRQNARIRTVSRASGNVD
jgi:hypothetical protein